MDWNRKILIWTNLFLLAWEYKNLKEESEMVLFWIKDRSNVIGKNLKLAKKQIVQNKTSICGKIVNNL